MKNNFYSAIRIIVAFLLIIAVGYFAGKEITSSYMARYFKEYSDYGLIGLDVAVESNPFYLDVINGLATVFIGYLSFAIIKHLIYHFLLEDLPPFKGKKWL